MQLHNYTKEKYTVVIGGYLCKQYIYKIIPQKGADGGLAPTKLPGTHQGGSPEIREGGNMTIPMQVWYQIRSRGAYATIRIYLKCDLVLSKIILSELRIVKWVTRPPCAIKTLKLCGFQPKSG